jgi:general secretion pathway protein G
MVKRQLLVVSCGLFVQHTSAAEVQPPLHVTNNKQQTTNNCPSGFTLVELMVVMAIIAILTTFAIPAFVANVKHAREAVLREDLFTMRGAIDQYTSDKQKAPQSLDDLVQAGYLREMPKDPFTHRTDTWIPDQGSILTTLDETAGGIDNVHSGAQDVGTDGTTYNTW